MKKIFFAVIATVCSLTAIGQTQLNPLQYSNDYLLPHHMSIGNCVVDVQQPFLIGVVGALPIQAVAQPFFIDSTICVKGLAATVEFYQPHLMNVGYPAYVQIRDSSLTNILAQIRYDTITRYSSTYAVFTLEQLFDNPIFISDSKFYVVFTFPPFGPAESSSGVYGLANTATTICNDGDFPLLVLGAENKEGYDWIPDGWMPLKDFRDSFYLNTFEQHPFELYLYPILGNQSSSLSQINLDNLTYIYPNPATKEVTFASSIGLTKIELVNVLGQKVYEQEVKANSMTIDVSHFAKGNYVVKLHTDKGTTTKKFVVE